MTRCLLLTISLLAAGINPCDAFAAASRPTAAASSAAAASSIRRPILASTISASADGDGAAAAAPAADDDDDTTEISSLLRPPYEIEPIPLRIGHGFDIHRMVPYSEAKQPIVVGGVIIDHVDQKWTDREGTYTGMPGSIYETQLGVIAHSDGDVIYHSIVDAIFGALTLPDIGQVFQDTDPRWRGCDSSKFMEHAYGVMTYHGYRIGNVDVTLILERPKVANFKPRMKENIVRLLHTTSGRVNIKARTHERLDSVGELRSLSCHVVITLEKVVGEA
jgi:2-C-methyl-D-erythritol 2,4-cyclodiphosphate synthase